MAKRKGKLSNPLSGVSGGEQRRTLADEMNVTLGELTDSMTTRSRQRGLAFVPDQQNGIRFGDKFLLGTTGLTVLDDEAINHDEWLTLGRVLRTVDTALQWWVGDWLNYGIQRKYGETYDTVAEILGMTTKTLQNWAYVSKHVETSLRREVLSFGHHALVAGMDAADQAHWLDHAEQNTLSVAQMRAAIKGDSNTEAPILPVVEHRQRLTKISQLMGRAQLSPDERATALDEIAEVERWLAQAKKSIKNK